MESEAIKALGSPPVRSSPSRPAVGVENANIGSVSAEQAGVAHTGGDVVSISPDARAMQPEKVSQNSSRFEVNDNNEVVLKIVDANTGQEIRQIPAKEQQRLSQAIQDTVDTLINNNKK